MTTPTLTEAQEDSLISQLERAKRDLAAAQSRLREIEQQWAAYSLELAAAQEARERAADNIERLAVQLEAAHAHITALKDDRERAEALAESLKADAERMTFLQDKCSVTFSYKRPDGTCAWIGGPTNLRAAIDAATKEMP